MTRDEVLRRIRKTRAGRRSVSLVALVLVAVLGFPATAPAERFRIRAVEDPGACEPRVSPCWKPGVRHISKGDVVVWKNPASNSVHNVTAINKGKWTIAKTLDPGDTAKRRFRSTGKYKYRCTIHSTIRRRDGRKICNGMCGVVHVGN